jgi:DNA polymerase III alpha subunit (gram-positive type)
MHDIQFYLIDTETTGLAKYHEVVQLSVIRCKDRHQLSKYIIAEHPERASEEALRVTNKTKADLLKGDPKEQVVDLVHNFLESDNTTPEHRCIIGHNIHKFDMRFLHALWEKCNMEFPAYLWLDTIPFTKAYATKFGISSPGGFNLRASLDLVNIEVKAELHNAITDSQYNYRLWKKLMESGVDYVDHMRRKPHLLNKDSDE